MECIGRLQEYLEYIPVYSQIPTVNETICSKYTIFSGILRNTEYIPWTSACEECMIGYASLTAIICGKMSCMQNQDHDSNSLFELFDWELGRDVQLVAHSQ